MARIVKEEQYSTRRNEILDAALRLTYQKGFESMTIQDILAEIKISKGAFYHYFDSKSAVLEAMIERMVIEDVEPLLLAVLANDSLTGIQKLHAYFDTSTRWKSSRKALMVSLTRVYYADENAVFRQKLNMFAKKKITPLLGQIVRQGVREGDFNTPFPDQAGQVIMHILEGLSDTLIELLVAADQTNCDQAQIESTITGYIAALTDAIERVLGAKPGAIHIIEPQQLMEWFLPDEAASAMAEPMPIAQMEAVEGSNAFGPAHREVERAGGFS